MIRGANRAGQGGGGDMAMGTGASGNSPRGPRDRNHPKLRRRGTRKARVQRVDLEGLETRALLATIPAASATAGPQNISSLFGNAGGLTANQGSPVVAVDPPKPPKPVGGWGGGGPGRTGLPQHNNAGGVQGGDRNH